MGFSPPGNWGFSNNPIPTRGADYAHRITACPPGFENLAATENFTRNFEKGPDRVGMTGNFGGFLRKVHLQKPASFRVKIEKLS